MRNRKFTLIKSDENYIKGLICTAINNLRLEADRHNESTIKTHIDKRLHVKFEGESLKAFKRLYKQEAKNYKALIHHNYSFEPNNISKPMYLKMVLSNILNKDNT